jgi:hypothetical protein
VKWATTLLTETVVGKAIPLPIFAPFLALFHRGATASVMVLSPLLLATPGCDLLYAEVQNLLARHNGREELLEHFGQDLSS